MFRFIATIASLIAPIGALSAQEVSDCREVVRGERWDGIECSITNSTSYPISRLDYGVRITGEDRAIPWTEEGYPGSPYRTMNIRGGIEPGETIRIELIIFSVFPKRADPDNVVFEADILKLYDVNDNEISFNSPAP